MAQFQAFAPGVEVNGETVLSVLDGMGAFRDLALRILAENGLINPQAGQWYSQQAWLDAFKTISERLGPTTLRIIGTKIPSNAQWPPDVDTLEKALTSIDVAYHLNHRGGEIGYYRFELTSPTSGKMVCENPYPSDFDYGIIQGTARKFAPLQGVQIELDGSQPNRKQGAASCTFLIRW